MQNKTQLRPSAYYDSVRATQMAAVAQQIYSGPAVVERAARRQWGCRDFIFLDVESTQCCVASNYEDILVAFRGTEPRLEDWLTDLDYTLVDGPLGGRVHQGFYDAVANVWRLLDDEVGRLLRDRPRKLWVTGHSLGGAAATLAAARWAEDGLPVAGVYTFGQPRVGDRQFARGYDFLLRPRAFRIVNHLDIVTRMPARSMGYCHNGTLIYLTEEGHAEDDEFWWRRFLDGWCGTIDTIFDWCGEGIDDHRMSNYVAQLTRLSPAAPFPERLPPTVAQTPRRRMGRAA